MVGPVSPGLVGPTLKVSLSLPHSAVSVPDSTPAPVQSPADEFATQDYSSLPGSRTSTPTNEMSGSRMSTPTYESLSIALTLPCPRRWVLLLWCPRLGRLSWPGLSHSICQGRRVDCRRSSSRRIVFDRICMWIQRTYTPLFEMSPVPDGDLSLISPATTQELLSPPPAPLPSSIQIKIDPALLLRLATAYQEWLPHPPPYLLRSHD